MPKLTEPKRSPITYQNEDRAGWKPLVCGRCNVACAYVHEGIWTDPDAADFDPYVVCSTCALIGPPVGDYRKGYR